MDLVGDPLEPWRELDAERETLPLEMQAIFILICVESIVEMGSSPDPVSREYLRAVWQSVDHDRTRLPALAASLGGREDIDDRDELAALLYAVEALRGSHEAATWGAQRLRDDAYERIPRARFSPLKSATGST